jgi:lipopolysaccharide transport system permease protein
MFRRILNEDGLAGASPQQKHDRMSTTPSKPQSHSLLSVLPSLNLTRLVYLRDLVRELVVRDIKLRYNRSVLGIGWSLAVPLAQLAILNFVFGVILPFHIENFTTFLFAGLLPWSWFQSSLFAVTKTTRQNKDLIQQVGFPVGILPVITVTSQFLHFALALPILFFLLWWEGYPLSPALVALPLVMGLQFLLTLGLSYFIVPIESLFHDTEHLLGLGLFLLFYLTPVFYSPSSIPEKYLLIYDLNPLVHLLGAYRAILMEGVFPPLTFFLVGTVLAGILVVSGYAFYKRLHYYLIWEM